MKYRREIDGLRAVAVLPVILFHAGFDWFSGGYVGVDVFFVISGYLITTIIINEMDGDGFSIAKFYERRARRILPALFFVMLCCIPFAVLWMVPSQLKDFSQAMVAISFFASNILFWQNTDYFAPAAEEIPLLHTWTLAVEEQFYIFFPLLLMGLWRFGRNKVFLCIVVLSAFSFMLSEWGWRNQPTANFYLLPTRAWELGIGTICAFWLQQRAVGSNLFSATGMAMILISVFVYDKETPLPSLYALVPVIGAALIVLYCTPTTVIGKVLSSRLLVGVGLISFSAYLWHQPLFAFARIRALEHPPHWLMLFLAIATIALAWLTWRFVEQPLRKSYFIAQDSLRLVFKASAIAGLFFVILGVYGYQTNGMQTYWASRKSPQQNAIIAFLDYRSTDDYSRQFKANSCFISGSSDSFSQFDSSACLRLSDNENNYLLIGDSHAAHFSHALREKFASINLMQANASGCRPVMQGAGHLVCQKLCDHVFDFIEQNSQRISGVLMSARWRHEDADLLGKTIEKLRGQNIPVLVFGPTVEYATDFPVILVGLAENAFIPSVNRKALNNSWEKDNLIKQVAISHGAVYVSIVDLVCPEKKCKNLSDDNEPMQFDYGHFTLSGSRTVIQGFGDELDEFFHQSSSSH